VINHSDVAPTIDWVFCFTPLLGGVSRNWRSARLTEAVSAHPLNALATRGVRWCSEGQVVSSPRRQSIPPTASSLAEELGVLGWGFGTVANIAVVSEGRLAQNVGWFAHHFDRPSAKAGAMEWSLALVREGGRSREGIRVVGPGALDVISMLGSDIGVDYSLHFPTFEGEDRPGLTALYLDGRRFADSQAPQHGRLFIDSESVPELFVELSERFGNGSALNGWAGTCADRPVAKNERNDKGTGHGSE